MDKRPLNPNIFNSLLLTSERLVRDLVIIVAEISELELFFCAILCDCFIIS